MIVPAAGRSPDDAAEDVAAFEEAFRRLREAERVYLRLGQLTAASPDYRDPAAFCRDVIDRTLTGEAFASADARARFFAWGLGRSPPSKLLPVLACHAHLARGDARAALAYARRAVGLNPNDLHAQRLYGRCRPDAPPEPDLRGRFCSVPFDKMETSTGGRVFFCCPAWLPVPIGNLDTQSPEEIWNSQPAQEIRRSILDGSYRYCSRMHCPKLTAHTLPASRDVTDGDHRAFIEARRTDLPRGPRRVVLSHDRSCNLSCPSCRTKMFVARKEEQERLNAIADRVILPLLRNARRVHVTGSGDPLGSGHFRYILKKISRNDFPHLVIDLQTNGLLLDRKAWSDLELSGLVDRVYISIDAARERTYAVVRRGGSLPRLLENLAFVAERRRAGDIRFVRLDFVVQALNFREMPEVADIVRAFGFDGLKFQMIRNWNTYGAEEFERHHIGSPDHPLFGELLEVLADERLRADFIEYWGFYGIDPGHAHAGGRA